MNIIPNGFLLSIEGIDGAGKSSLLTELTSQLHKKFNVLCTKEPGGTPLGKEIRALLQYPKSGPIAPQAEFLLFAADRAHHFTTLVLPALMQGSLVISDRMADSAVAYQGYGRGLDISCIAAVNSWAMQGRKPDLTIYLQLDYRQAQERITQRNDQLTAFEQEKASFFARVLEGFEKMYHNRADVLTLDATLPLATLAQQSYARIVHDIAHSIKG